MRNKWIVVLHGNGDDDFELSVCLDNAHGVKSWGWPGMDKIIILDGSSFDADGFTSSVKSHYLQRARRICDALNKD